MTAPAFILVVDDEPPILRVLKPSLAASGYAVAVAETGEAALEQAAQSNPDVVILDLGLPDLDGKDVIARLREWSSAAIIVLSARDEAEERIEALDVGADDYVTKPFHMGELQARVRTALRRREEQKGGEPVFRSQGLEIDFLKRRVKIDGDEVRLTPREYDLLRNLARHAGQVVSHKHLLQVVWGSEATDVQLVRVFIGQLRQKLELNASAPRLILTEPGIGYRLRADD